MIKKVLAGVATRNLSASISFYQNLLAREPDGQPMPELAEWKLPGGCLQIFSSVTMVVENLEAELRRPGNSQAVKAILQDPDGNRVVLAQHKSQAVTQ